MAGGSQSNRESIRAREMEANALDPIRHQINAGDQRGARIALVELLEAEPDNADAWALLAILLTDPAEQAQCYREILRINPSDRQAEVWLESLTGQVTEQPTGAQTLAQGPSGRSCPRCGSMVKVSPLQGSPGQTDCLSLLWISYRSFRCVRGQGADPGGRTTAQRGQPWLPVRP